MNAARSAQRGRVAGVLGQDALYQIERSIGIVQLRAGELRRTQKQTALESGALGAVGLHDQRAKDFGGVAGASRISLQAEHGAPPLGLDRQDLAIDVERSAWVASFVLPDERELLELRYLAARIAGLGCGFGVEIDPGAGARRIVGIGEIGRRGRCEQASNVIGDANVFGVDGPRRSQFDQREIGSPEVLLGDERGTQVSVDPRRRSGDARCLGGPQSDSLLVMAGASSARSRRSRVSSSSGAASNASRACAATSLQRAETSSVVSQTPMPVCALRLVDPEKKLSLRLDRIRGIARRLVEP